MNRKQYILLFADPQQVPSHYDLVRFFFNKRLRMHITSVKFETEEHNETTFAMNYFVDNKIGYAQRTFRIYEYTEFCKLAFDNGYAIDSEHRRKIMDSLFELWESSPERPLKDVLCSGSILSDVDLLASLKNAKKS